MLLYCICTPECDAYVGVFEEVGKFSFSWTVVSKECPFFVSVFFFVGFMVDFLL